MKRRYTMGAMLAAVSLAVSPAYGGWPGDAVKCKPDAVKAGSVCMDKYEASVWQVPPTQRGLITKIQNGTAKLTDLTTAAPVAAGVVQLGLASGDLGGAGCPDTGNGCVNVYAVSIPGVTPSRFITWFQAVAAARNSRKRLPSNLEWQAAALGTPNGAPCLLAVGGAGPGLTGTAGCVSDVGAFDMLGNLWEWVAEWAPLFTPCANDPFGTGDGNLCLAEASTTSGPGAIMRGGGYVGAAGIFRVYGVSTPSDAGSFIGFRAAR